MAVAFFTTWTTYGTWLPGDPRGWYAGGRGLQQADARRRFEATLRMADAALTLTPDQRRLVEETVAEHCAIRGWTLHAVNCRTNHVHAVVTAPKQDIETPREQFKAWCTRRLKIHEGRRPARENWRTERGWDEYLDDEVALENAINYTLDGQ